MQTLIELVIIGIGPPFRVQARLNGATIGEGVSRNLYDAMDFVCRQITAEITADGKQRPY